MSEAHKGITGATKLLKKLASFPWEDWNASLAKDLEQPYRDLVIATGQVAAKSLGATLDAKDPLLSKFMTSYVLERATLINDTTKASVTNVIQTAFADGDAEGLGDKVLETMREDFDGYEAWRAERIARSESAIGFNHANALGWSTAGVEEVDILDGTEDDVCDEANGATWTLAEFMADPIGHPNCVRGASPVVPDDFSRKAFERMMLDKDLPYLCAIAAELISGLDDPCGTRVLDAIDGDL